ASGSSSAGSAIGTSASRSAMRRKRSVSEAGRSGGARSFNEILRRRSSRACRRAQKGRMRSSAGARPEPVLEREVLDVEMRQRLAQLRKLLGRAVNLETSDVGDLQGLLQQRADVLHVCEQAFGVRVTLSAVHLVPVER